MSLREALDALVDSEPFERLLLARARPIVAKAEAGEDFLLAGLAVALNAPVLVVTPGPKEAEELTTGIGAYLGPDDVALLPAWDALPYEGMGPAPEVAARRADALARLRSADGPCVVVAPYLAAMQAVPPSLGTVGPLQLAAGVEIAPHLLAERLSELGYVRVDVVEHRGKFAVRGGVLDVFPGTARRPARLEYLGDEIERLREFSPSTQLSTSPIGVIDVSPVRELLPDEELRSIAAARAPTLADRFRDGLQRLADGLRFEGSDTLAPFLFDHMPTPAELLPTGSWVVVTQAQRTLQRAARTHAEAEALAEAIGWPGPTVLPPIEEAIAGHVQLQLTEFTEGIDLGLSSWGTAAGNASELASRLDRAAGGGGRGGGGGGRAPPTAPSSAPPRSSARSRSNGSKPRSHRVSTSRRVVWRSSRRRICSAPGGTRGPRRGSHGGVRRPSRTSWSPVTSPSTGSTASVATAAWSIVSWPEPSGTTSSWSTRATIACTSRRSRWGWSRSTWAETLLDCIASAARIGRGRPRG
jgi:hypothetical protein